MRAVVCTRAGGPEVLRVRELPDPEPRPGEVVIRVRAFGLNRSEMYTRQGHSPSVVFPRVLGIECVGEVESAPGTDLVVGQKVAAMMGDMGRAYDGGYAEKTRVPCAHVFPVDTDLPWSTLGALPEMIQTVHGSLRVGLELAEGETLLVRGGTSSIGMTAAMLAKRQGARVLATTRNPNKIDRLRENGADEVVIETGEIADAVREVAPGGVDKVLELVGTTTLKDSMRATRPGGVVCMTGILGDAWAFDHFEPLIDIPNGVRLTSYGGGSGDITVEQLQHFVDDVAAGRISVRIAKLLALEEVADAHQGMEEGRFAGKLVGVPDPSDRGSLGGPDD